MVARRAKVEAKGKEVVNITKSVKMPLTVVMTGSKEALSVEGEKLVAKLKENLPFVMRLGRGRKETISIGLK